MERIYIASAEELENAAYPGTDRLLFALLPEANFYILDADENSGELFYVLSNDVKRISDPPLWLNFFVLPWRKKKYTPRERKARISAEKDLLTILGRLRDIREGLLRIYDRSRELFYRYELVDTTWSLSNDLKAMVEESYNLRESDDVM
jgi:hypothetical protein